MVIAPMPDETTTVAEGRPRVLRERYEILDVLGEGAMGIVYRARDRELDRVVAIKTIDAACASDAATHARLQQEASAAARLTHPGIVTIYDVAVAGGVPYIVMEYFRGRTLSALLAGGALPPDKAVRVVVQVCRALRYAHAEGVVHRDVKSSNIMVDAGWRVKLTDFGVARVVGRREHDATIVGTPAYIAPEQALGGAADARSDLFSLGVVLYEALTGERPFPSEDFTTVLHEVVHLDPVPARERNFAVSPALDAVVRRVMSKAPDDRYPDAGAFAEALTQALADPPGALEWTAARRGRVLAAIVAALSIVAAGAAVWRGPVENPAVLPAPAEPPTPPAPAPPAADAPAPPAPPPAVTPAAPRVVVIERPVMKPPRVVVIERPVVKPPRVVVIERRAAEPRRVEPEPAAPVAGEAPAPPPEAPAPVSAKTGCLSVNAVPFATLYVDGRAIAETPRACVRLAVGRHRVVFESMDERSPEEAVVIEDQHTADTPLRVSYDFRTRQFLAR
jgi:serine/threonine-protein kinase